FHSPRYIHSCPTRRSSDLFILEDTIKFAESRILISMGINCLILFPKKHKGHSLLFEFLMNHQPIWMRNLSSLADIFKKMLLQFRSEEHTSELQSRENLVCR